MLGALRDRPPTRARVKLPLLDAESDRRRDEPLLRRDQQVEQQIPFLCRHRAGRCAGGNDELSLIGGDVVDKWHGMTRAEVAAATGLSEIQVKGHLQYALSLLRKAYLGADTV